LKQHSKLTILRNKTLAGELFINNEKLEAYKRLARYLVIETFEKDDIILKQDDINNKIYIIIEGIVEIINEKHDYEFFNYQTAGNILFHHLIYYRVSFFSDYNFTTIQEY